MNKKICKKVLEHKDNFIPHIFTNRQINIIEKYLKGNKSFQKEIINSVLNWTDDLHDWDISRDGPYFGFKIPGETDQRP